MGSSDTARIGSLHVAGVKKTGRYPPWRALEGPCRLGSHHNRDR